MKFRLVKGSTVMPRHIYLTTSYRTLIRRAVVTVAIGADGVGGDCQFSPSLYSRVQLLATVH